MQQFVGFHLGAEEYCIDILKIREIIRVPQITKVPRAPEFIKGVVNLRGKIIPVIDLRERFGLDTGEGVKATRIIVVDIDKKSTGLIVDGVSNVFKISVDQIEPPPPIITGVSAEYIRGVGKLDGKMLIIVNVEKTLSFEEKNQLMEAVKE